MICSEATLALIPSICHHFTLWLAGTPHDTERPRRRHPSKTECFGFQLWKCVEKTNNSHEYFMPDREETKRWRGSGCGAIVIFHHIPDAAKRAPCGEEACSGSFQEHVILPGLCGQVPQQDGRDPLHLPEDLADGHLQRLLDTAQLSGHVSSVSLSLSLSLSLRFSTHFIS